MNEKNETEKVKEEYICEDPVILDAFRDLKTAILAKRNDIVRQILSAAQSIRDEDEFDSDVEDHDKKVLIDKYDSEEYLDLLSLLLSHKDTDSGTLLHYATRIDSADIVRTLLAAGANCLVKNKENFNPYMYCSSPSMQYAYIGELMQAVSQSRTYRVKQLLSAGIDVNSRDGAASGNSVLHWAVSFADLPTIKIIIEEGADVNAVNADGVVSLHDAITRGNPEIVEELLKNGANVNVQPFKGKYENISPEELGKSNPVINELIKQYSEQESVNLSCNGDKDILENEFDHDETNSIEGKSPSITSIQSTVQQLSLLPVAVKIDPLVFYICPPPQKVVQFEGLFFVPPENLAVHITANKENICDVHDVLHTFEDKFENIGVKLSFEYHGKESIQTEQSTRLHCIVNENSFTHKEEYRIQINTNKVLIISTCLVSMFRGLTTFLQCLKLFKGKAVPLLQIWDWPTCLIRSVMFDFGTNDIPSIEVFCSSIDLLASFKVNQIQLNVEHVINQTNNVHYTSREFCEIQMYCKKRFVSVVPFIKFDKLSSDLRLKNGSNHPDEESLLKIIDLFFDKSYIHFQVRGTGSSRLVQQLHHFCNTRDAFMQLSTNHLDMHLDHMATLMNGFAYTVNVSQVQEVDEQIHYTDTFGLPSILCYASDQFCRIYPNVFDITKTVHDMSALLVEHHCFGLCVKLCMSSRQLCNFTNCLPPLLLSAAFGWNRNASFKEEVIENVINYFIFEDDNDIIGKCFLKLGKIIPLLGEGGGCLFDHMLQNSALDFSSLSADMLQGICRTIKSCKQNIEHTKLRTPLKLLLREELNATLNVIFFLCRILYGVIGQKRKDTQSPKIEDLTEFNRSDFSNRLMSIITAYESYVSLHYKAISSDHYVSLNLLKDLLLKILPVNNLPPSSTGLFGVFTI